MAATIVALHDDLPTNEDELDAEPAMLAAIQLVEKATSLFEGKDEHNSLDDAICMRHLQVKILERAYKMGPARSGNGQRCNTFETLRPPEI